MPGKVPDRWEAYKPLGKPIPGTRFITFKVPLGEDICRRLPEEEHFTPSMLLEQTRSSGWDLGMIVDLTNTKRYYKPEVFTNAGVEYEKIYTEGHIVPTSTVRKTFFRVMDEFLGKNVDNDKLLGIHCTHGVNRTGFLVCRYMIDRFKMDPEQVLKKYEEARGYPVERENYVNDLKTGKCHEDEDFVEVQQPRQPQQQHKPKDSTAPEEQLATDISEHRRRDVKRQRPEDDRQEDRSWRLRGTQQRRPRRGQSNHGRQNDTDSPSWWPSSSQHGWDNSWSNSGWTHHQGGWGAYTPASGYGQFGHNTYWQHRQQQQQSMQNAMHTQPYQQSHDASGHQLYDQNSGYNQNHGYQSRNQSNYGKRGGRSAGTSRGRGQRKRGRGFRGQRDEQHSISSSN